MKAVTKEAVTNDPVTSDSVVTSAARASSPRHRPCRFPTGSVRTAVCIAIACDDDINWRTYLERPTRAELRAAQKSWRDIDSPTPGERALTATLDRRTANARN